MDNTQKLLLSRMLGGMENSSANGSNPFGQLNNSEVNMMRNNAPSGNSPFGQINYAELIKKMLGGSPSNGNTPFGQMNNSEMKLAGNTPNPNNTLTPNNAQGSSSQSDMKNYVNHLMATFNSTVDPATRNAIQTELNNFGIPPEYYTAPQGAR